MLRIAARVAERNKGLFKSFKRKYPHVPDYVMREVYNGTDKDKSKSTSIEGMMKEVGSREWKKTSVDLHISELSGLTRRNLIRRKFGLDNPDDVPDDAERLERQIKSVGSDNEPMIMFETDGGLELVEGFHRTMARLLSGSKDFEEDLKKIAKAKDDKEVEEIAKSWKPVKTKIWLGTGEVEEEELNFDW